jgi:hypothetical protein
VRATCHSYKLFNTPLPNCLTPLYLATLFGFGQNEGYSTFRAMSDVKLKEEPFFERGYGRGVAHNFLRLHLRHRLLLNYLKFNIKIVSHFAYANFFKIELIVNLNKLSKKLLQLQCYINRPILNIKFGTRVRTALRYVSVTNKKILLRLRCFFKGTVSRDGD